MCLTAEYLLLSTNIGLTAFDFVIDFDEWINSGYFDEETQARLKGWRNFAIY